MKKSKSKTLNDSYNEEDDENIVDESVPIDDEVFEEEEEEEDEDDDSSKKRKRKSTTSTKKITVAPSVPITQLPYQDRIFIVYNHENNQQPKSTSNNNRNNENIEENDDLTILSLLNPKTNNESRYVLDKKNQIIMEINNYKELPSSWFMDNSVRYDGSLYITTPIDPLFLIIPYLEKSRENGTSKSNLHYIEISQLESEPQFRALKNAGYSFDESQLELICDHTNLYSSKLYVLDDSKLILWLKCKAKQLAHYLETSNTNIYRQNSFSKQQKQQDSSIWTQMALEFLSEYISDKFIQKLKQSLTDSTNNNKSVNGNNNSNSSHGNTEESLVYNPRDNAQFTVVPAKILPSPPKKKLAGRAKFFDTPKQNSKISDFFSKK